jgi:hypothetical protein
MTEMAQIAVASMLKYETYSALCIKLITNKQKSKNGDELVIKRHQYLYSNEMGPLERSRACNCVSLTNVELENANT